MAKPIKRWIEVSPTYLTDTKKRPIEALLFVNHVRYNPSAKTPTLRRRVGLQTLTGNTKREITDALIHFLKRRDVRLLADGLESNDFKRLPPIVRNPPRGVVTGRARIYNRLGAI